jgi:hypothetical protein
MSLAPKEAYACGFIDFYRSKALYLRPLINYAVVATRQIVILTAVRRSSITFATFASLNQSTRTVDNSVGKPDPLTRTGRSC